MASVKSLAIIGSSIAAGILLFSGCGSSTNVTSGGSSFPNYDYNVTSGGVLYDNSYAAYIKDMEFSADGKTLYAAGGSSVGQALAIINLETNTSDIVDTGYYGRYVKLSKDGNTAYVTSGSDAMFTSIDLTTNTVSNNVALTNYSIGIAISSDGNTAYIGAEGEGFHTLNLTDDTFTTTALDYWGTTVLLSEDESTLYVSDSGAGLQIYDVASDTYATVTTTNVWAADMALSPDETKAYMAAESVLEIIDVASTSIETTITDINASDSFGMIKAVKATADGRRLFVVDKNYDDTLFMVDLENNNAVSYIMNTSATLCGSPDSVEIAPDGASVYMGCQSGTIAKFDIQ